MKILCLYTPVWAHSDFCRSRNKLPDSRLKFRLMPVPVFHFRKLQNYLEFNFWRQSFNETGILSAARCDLSKKTHEQICATRDQLLQFLTQSESRHAFGYRLFQRTHTHAHTHTHSLSCAVYTDWLFISPFTNINK